MQVPFYLSYAALWILVIFQSLVLLGVVRMVHELRQTGVAARMSAGQEAPKFSAVALSGVPIGSAGFAGRLTALLFVSSDCSACLDTLENNMGYLSYKAQGNLIVICKAGQAECARLGQRYQLTTPIVADEDGEISRLFAVSSVPTAVVINAQNRIQSYGQPEREEPKEVLENAPDLERQAVG